jgi:ATP-dependent RNA/DNA helicase IGHMBP2
LQQTPKFLVLFNPCKLFSLLQISAHGSNVIMLPDDHFLHLKHLLDLGSRSRKARIAAAHAAALTQGAEATGNTLINLVIRAQDAGMGGRVLVTLGKKNENLPLPWTRLGTGAPVILSEAGESGGWRGIVSSLDHKTIQVAFPDWPEPETDRPIFRLDRAPDEVARKRQRQAYWIAPVPPKIRAWQCCECAAGCGATAVPAVPMPAPLDRTLNEVPARRRSFCPDCPGRCHHSWSTRDRQNNDPGRVNPANHPARRTRTGSRTLQPGSRQPVGKAAGSRRKGIRLGHPARVLPELRQHTLDILVETHPDLRLANKLAREAYALRGQAAKYTRAKPQPGARYAMRQEARELLADARKIEDQVIERILDGATVICATSTGLDRNILGERSFEWCIMDEASQSTEPGAWIPLQFARRLVLAGDHFQLPPTVVSTAAAAAGFNVSLLERLVKELGPQIARRLDVQYRMHTDIMSFSSREFYENSLVAHESVASHLLQDLPGVQSNDSRPLRWILSIRREPATMKSGAGR